ncbi:MAG: esterase/lipase family protein [Phycisphaerales bacterium]
MLDRKTNFLRIAIILLIVSATGILVGAGDHQPEDGTEPFIERFSIPLDDGRIELGELFGRVLDELGFDGDEARDELDWSIDVQGALGGAQLALVERMTKGVVRFEVEPAALVIEVDRLQARRQEQRLRSEFRAHFERWFPEAARSADEVYGFRVFDRNDEWTAVDAGTALPGEVVVLIHGLDDPGIIWNSLRPELLAHDVPTLEFHYPNDQSIRASAIRFTEELISLRAHGVERVQLVAHSMGGLVCRETLTAPTLYGGNATGHADRPDLVRIIMVGPPNYGSEMARFRFLSEARDQIARALSGDGLLFGSVFDGAGEAQVDLLPGSDFLVALNSRPIPRDCPVTIIAGNVSPVTTSTIDLALAQLRPWAPNGEVDQWLLETRDALAEVANGAGDGCVSLESARLAGVDDFVVVHGNHVTMIRSVPVLSNGGPPAIPVILDRLGVAMATPPTTGP